MGWAKEKRRKLFAWNYLKLSCLLPFRPLPFLLSPFMHGRRSNLPCFLFNRVKSAFDILFALLTAIRERKRQSNLKHGLLEGKPGFKVRSSVGSSKIYIAHRAVRVFFSGAALAADRVGWDRFFDGKVSNATQKRPFSRAWCCSAAGREEPSRLFKTFSRVMCPGPWRPVFQALWLFRTVRPHLCLGPAFD